MKKRLFLIVWLAGIIGVLSFLLVDLSALIAALPARPGDPSETPHPALLKLASVLQPAVLTTIAV
ncbi:hypothetical protein BH20ACI2_BH20ACI2_10850 [soil metagenome]